MIAYGANFLKAAAKITDDAEEPLAFKLIEQPGEQADPQVWKVHQRRLPR